jgi:pSer/pThr/pTyr-binding forkhead associated (FHA) protein
MVCSDTFNTGSARGVDEQAGGEKQMAKIILSLGDTIVQEMNLSKERITIGRRPHNDIVIDDLAISGEHAVIVLQNNESFLEDLNSTNGTQINGQPIRKHFLQDEDVVELAQYRMRYMAGLPCEEESQNKRLMSNALNHEYGEMGVAMIKVLNGANTGKEILLDKVITTIGRPGLQVAVITRRESDYYLDHVEGEHYPMVNGAPIDSDSYLIRDGDVIELSGTQMRFSLHCQK